MDKLYASKGKKTTFLDLSREKPDVETLKGLLLGPTGNLRSPAVRKGRTLLIGFNREQYQEVFG